MRYTATIPAPEFIEHKILVVEKDAIVASVTRWLLESKGWQVTVATRTDDVMDCLIADPPGVVLAGSTLRDDGMGVVDAVKSRNPNMPVMLIAEGPVDASCDFMVRPVDPDQLHARLADAVRKAEELVFPITVDALPSHTDSFEISESP